MLLVRRCTTGVHYLGAKIKFGIYLFKSLTFLWSNQVRSRRTHLRSPVYEMDTTNSNVDSLRNERFHLKPYDRIRMAASIGGLIGAGLGFYEGVKLSSLRYLTENAHRLPTTVGGWYFYHKKKNYVMIISGCKDAARLGLKYSLGVSSFFALEYLIDYTRNTIDFLNTTAAGAIVAYTHGSIRHMTKVQKFNHVKKGSFLALVLGLSQDMMIFSRGGDLWYKKAFNDIKTLNFVL